MLLNRELLASLLSCLVGCLCVRPVAAQEISISSCRPVLPDNLSGSLEEDFSAGNNYLGTQQFDLAIQSYETLIARLEQTEHQELFKSQVALYLAAALYQSGNADKAVAILEQTVETLSQSGPITVELGIALQNLGQTQEDLGNFKTAAEHYAQAVNVFETLACVEYQLVSLISTATVQTWLGQYDEANKTLYSNLNLSQRIGDVDAISKVYHTLGWVAFLQERYDPALEFYQTALEYRQRLPQEDAILQSRILNNIGHLYTRLGDADAAIINLQTGLELVTQTSAGIAERIDLFDSLGDAYGQRNDSAQAWVNYHQALRIARQSGQRHRQLISLLNVAKTLASEDEITLAIALYKQAINEIEQVRANLRSLPLETQQRYTETVAHSYRELAALLFAQERVFEAQQILDLLKIQELEDYFQDVRAERPRVNKIPYLAPEQRLLNRHQALLLADLTETDPVLSLENFLNDPEVAAALEMLGRLDETKLQPEPLHQLQQKLQRLPHRSAVLYPLVLEDRLELLLVPPNGAPIHQTTAIGKPTLTDQVNTLRHYLADPSSDVKTIAGPLYESIIRPFQQDLHTLGIQNIIYIPDGVLHYIPLSVLYDENQQQWLTEQYTSHNLTASDIGDLIQPPSRPFHILAGAFADADQTFETLIDRQAINFQGLTYAGQEVAFLQKMLPATEVLLDADFSRSNLRSQLQGQNIVHLATHAAFVPGQPEDSFILLGNGDIITLKELRRWSLPNVDLVVLSACQTGISHIEDGLEILGMGFQVQRTDARSALASLWWVDDRSTSQLMQLFYTELAAGATKVDALQKAQRQLIARGKSEPYYWAPFVLIGNGL
ncbi:MAG: CHAT domain-containing protein [Cyanobacteria bacterium J06628_4]